jgi:hypothetical protein
MEKEYPILSLVAVAIAVLGIEEELRVVKIIE